MYRKPVSRGRRAGLAPWIDSFDGRLSRGPVYSFLPRVPSLARPQEGLFSQATMTSLVLSTNDSPGGAISESLKYSPKEERGGGGGTIEI